MSVELRAVTGVVFVVIAGAALAAGRQAPPSGPISTAQLKQIAYLKASNPEAEDHFGCGGVLDGHAGWGVAISSDGSTVAIGAPHESSGAKGANGNQSDNSMYGSGAVYVFVRNGGRWVQQAYVKPSNPQMGAEFGHVVALSADGSTMAVSAYGEASKATGINGNHVPALPLDEVRRFVEAVRPALGMRRRPPAPSGPPPDRDREGTVRVAEALPTAVRGAEGIPFPTRPPDDEED